MLGVSHAAISKWENGQSKPSKVMALRLAELMSGVQQGRLTAEMRFTEPQLQVKALTRGTSMELLTFSAGFKSLWPEMVDFKGKALAPVMINEAQLYLQDSDLLKDSIKGELLMLSGVSNRFLAVGGDVPQSFRFRWHAIARRIDDELVHEVVFETCDHGSPTGIERLLRRSDLTYDYE